MTQNAEGQRMSWIQDDGKRFTGSGSLTLSVSNTGRAKGYASGPLGDLDLEGVFAEAEVALQMKPKQDSPEAFSGTLLPSKTARDRAAQRAPSEETHVGVLQLELRAASGDGKWVRSGTATLRKIGSP